MSKITSTTSAFAPLILAFAASFSASVKLLRSATVITKDGKVYTIVSKDIFKQRSSTDNGSSANTGQIVSEHTNARKGAKELPYTGTEDSVVSMVAAAASALLGLGLAGRRKEDEEA